MNGKYTLTSASCLVWAPLCIQRLRFTQVKSEGLGLPSFSFNQCLSLGCGFQGVSSMTIYRRRQEYGMLGTPNGTLSDAELRDVRSRMQQNCQHLDRRWFGAD